MKNEIKVRDGKITVYSEQGIINADNKQEVLIRGDYKISEESAKHLIAGYHKGSIVISEARVSIPHPLGDMYDDNILTGCLVTSDTEITNLVEKLKKSEKKQSDYYREQAVKLKEQYDYNEKMFKKEINAYKKQKKYYERLGWGMIIATALNMLAFINNLI